jgi:copper resistance protein D
LIDPLIWARLIHFTATIAVTGAVFFLALVAEPAFREAKVAGSMLAGTRRRLAAISWMGLAVAILSGAVWLVLQAAQMADLPLSEALSEGVAWTVLSDTDFGQAWTARLVIAGLLAASLPWLSASNPTLARQRAAVAIALAAALVGTLAWAGHGAAGAGVEGGLHLVADVLHLIAGAAWVGALVPLALLLRAALGRLDQGGFTVAIKAMPRFSTLGIASVGALFLSGIVNTWLLAGSIPALVGTEYGRLLLVKIALFLVMLLFAAANRLWLTPRIVLASDTDGIKAALEQVRRNTLIEAALGAIVIFIVSILGTMPPGLEALD